MTGISDFPNKSLIPVFFFNMHSAQTPLTTNDTEQASNP